MMTKKKTIKINHSILKYDNKEQILKQIKKATLQQILVIIVKFVNDENKIIFLHNRKTKYNQC